MSKKSKLFFFSFYSLCVFAYLFFEIGIANAQPTWFDRFDGKLTAGIVAAQEFRVVEEPLLAPDSSTLGVHRTWKSLGLVTVGVMKYSIKEYFDVFGGYGLSQRQFLQGNQVAVIGFSYMDLLGLTILAGMDTGTIGTTGRIGALNDSTRYFFGVGLTFDGFEFNVNDVVKEDVVIPYAPQ